MAMASMLLNTWAPAMCGMHVRQLMWQANWHDIHVSQAELLSGMENLKCTHTLL